MNSCSPPTGLPGTLSSSADSGISIFEQAFAKNWGKGNGSRSNVQNKEWGPRVVHGEWGIRRVVKGRGKWERGKGERGKGDRGKGERGKGERGKG